MTTQTQAQNAPSDAFVAFEKAFSNENFEDAWNFWTQLEGEEWEEAAAKFEQHSRKCEWA